jgi:hypothetical protein
MFLVFSLSLSFPLKENLMFKILLKNRLAFSQLSLSSEWQYLQTTPKTVTEN